MGAKSNLHALESKNASIELDNAQIYSPGDIVSGTLHLKHKEETNEGVSIDLIGEFGFGLNYTSDVGAAAMSTDSHLPFFQVSTSSITNEQKFSLRLKEELPPSVNLAVDTYPYIQYFLRVNLGKNKEHRHYIIVCPRVSIPHSIIQSLDFDATNDKEIHLSGSIDRNWVLPGETFKMIFQISNPRHKHIRHINGNIFMKAEFKRAECTEKVLDFTVDNLGDTSDEHLQGTISITIPSTYLPPTSTYTNDQHQFIVNINYWISIEMHLRDFSHQISTTIPLSIAFQPEKINFDEQYNPDCHQAWSFQAK